MGEKQGESSRGLFYAVVIFFLWRDANRNFAVDERVWVGMTDETIVAILVTSRGSGP